MKSRISSYLSCRHRQRRAEKRFLGRSGASLLVACGNAGREVGFRRGQLRPRARRVQQRERHWRNFLIELRACASFLLDARNIKS